MFRFYFFPSSRKLSDMVCRLFKVHFLWIRRAFTFDYYSLSSVKWQKKNF
jgi:hypothetical protein